jgi:type I restriction enzyme S subunit
MPTTEEGPYMLTAADIEFGRVNYEQARQTSEDAFLNTLSDKSKPLRGDLLLTKDGTLGRVTVFDGAHVTCISQSIALLRLMQEKVCSDFVSISLMGASYQTKMLFDAGGTTIKHIYISVLSKMNIALPGIEEQKEIVLALKNRLLRIDQLADKAQSVSILLQERRTALISAAVTGKIDVRDWQPAAAQEEVSVEC